MPNDFQSNANDSSNPDVSTAQIPIYKNTWFVIAMAIVVMAMLLLLAWFALRRMGGSQNFGHQRSSLKMHGRMTPPRGNLMLGMTPLPPYRSDGSIYNYSVHVSVRMIQIKYVEHFCIYFKTFSTLMFKVHKICLLHKPWPPYLRVWLRKVRSHICNIDLIPRVTKFCKHCHSV